MTKETFYCLIEPETMQKIRDKGIKYRKLVELGLQYLDERTALHEELKELRSGNAKLQKIVNSQGARLLTIENKNEKAQ